MRQVISAVLLAACLAVALPTIASASPSVFSQDELHFTVPEGVFVAVREVNAPEGPVRVVTLRPADPRGGQVEANSFLTFTLFSSDLPGEGSAEERALQIVVSGIVAAVSPVVAVSPEESMLRLAGRDVAAQRLRMSVEGARIEGLAGALEERGTVIVAYLHAVAGEQDAVARLQTALESFATGPAPESAGDERFLPGLIIE